MSTFFLVQNQLPDSILARLQTASVYNQESLSETVVPTDELLLRARIPDQLPDRKYFLLQI